MAVYALGEHVPCLEEGAYVAANATVIGRVVLGRNASVWFGAVLRGDNEPIHVGAGSNVQESAVLHADPGFPLILGDNVTVGHQAMLHGCTIGDGSLIGIQAVILNGAVIGRRSLVAAGAVVTEGKLFPEGSLILGAPAKVARPLSEAEQASLLEAAASYVERRLAYRSLRRIDEPG